MSTSRGWTFAIVVLVCLGISALYELIEWWTALARGAAADRILATQGDIWDTQEDMFMALIGAICALVLHATCLAGSARCEHDCRSRNSANPRIVQPQKYLTVFNLGIQNTFVYRWNYFLRAIFGIIPLAGTVFLWRAIFNESGGGMRGYDYGSMIYYYLLTILVSNLVTPTEDEWQIAADIREGQINSFLTKPMNYLGYRFSIFLSGRLVYTAVTILPIAAHLHLFPQLHRSA